MLAQRLHVRHQMPTDAIMDAQEGYS
jgi:hypothetical protein